MEKRTTLDYAKFYVSKGFPVIPIRFKDKQPAILSWKEYQDRLPSDEELNRWFGNGSTYNIAIVTGKLSGIVAVDLDSDRAVAFSKANNFPKTPLSKTGRGYHAIYKYKDGVRNFQKRDDLPDIDFRGEGGYICVEPSIHPSGQHYKWEDGKGLDDLPLAELPEIILAKRPEDKTPLKELYQGVPQGSRNDTLARLTGSWVNDGLSFDECLENAQIWNSKNNSPMNSGELYRTVKSIFERHKKEVSELSGIGVGQTDTPDFKPFSVLKKGSELGQLNITIEWAIDRLLPKQSITLLHGKGGIGKTWLSLIMADAINKRLPFMGLDTVSMPVVFVDFENSLPVLVDRIKKIRIEDVLFWHNSNETLKPPKLDKDDWNLYQQLPEGSLIIFDTLRASQGQDENDSRHMAFILSRLKELRDRGFTILLLHHAPKGNDRTYKGSTAILDLADHVLSLYKVRKNNPEGGEIEDDDDQNCLYRFGTKDKTRYEPFHIFMAFDKTQGFIKALDPDEEDLQAIYEILKDKGTLNQKQIFEILKDEIDIKSKGKAISLLRKGEGKYWTSRKVKNAVFYEPLGSVQVSTPIYGQTDTSKKDPLEVSRIERTDTLSNTLQSLDNSQVSECPEGIQTLRTDDVIEVLGVSE